MKSILTILLLLLLSCNQSVKTNTKSVTPVIKTIDTSKYTVFKFNSKREVYLFDSESKPADLTADEIADIETIIFKRVYSYNKQEITFWDSAKRKQIKSVGRIFEKKIEDTISHPEKYCKQLIAIVDDHGNKIVWVNCFYLKADFPYWKKDIVRVMDGGAYFFQIKINLTKKTVLSFYVNGVA